MDEHWRSFALHEVPIDPVPEPDWDSFVMFDKDDYEFKSKPEDPRIKLLRFDKTSGSVPPYCATAAVFFPTHTHPDDVELGLYLKDPKPSPLRNIALSNVPHHDLERSDSGYESNKEKRARKKGVSFGETIQVLEIDPDTAVEEQAWAHYPEVAKCKDWDGRSTGCEKRRHVRKKMKQWSLPA
jgi:hypothetical protein